MYERMPDDLKKLDRWVCWRFEARDGKPTKVPINPLSGGRAMSDNPATWGCFYDAVNAVWPDVQGIGFMFSGDGIIGVDLDHCKDDDGNLTAEAKDIISTLDSYTEYSQSGHGIHIICNGKMPEGRKRKGNVEMYCAGRFFIMTGNALDDAHTEVEERTEELAEIHKKYLADKKKPKKAPVVTQELELDDRDLLDKAMAAGNGSRFRALYNGDTSGNGKDDSAADLALCNLLAFWTQCNASQMDGIFRQSGLMRDKWDERHGADTYGNITISKAIADCNKVYTPKRAKVQQSETEDPESDAGFEALLNSDPGPREEKSIMQQDPTTDLGRSKIFSHKYKDLIRWCGENKCWLVWNGKQWDSDKMLMVTQFAKETVEEFIIEAAKAIAQATGEDEIKRAKQRWKDAMKAKGERQIKSMMELAKSDLPITVGQLDKNPFLLNCQNGIIDLKTGKLLQHEPEKYMTKIANASYESGKQFKKFGQFLKDITCDDKTLADYFQMVCGMAAVGKVFHEGMCIFFGSGRNGKSTFLNLMSSVFGDYACQINTEALMSQRDGRQIIGGVSVEGKRFATAMEIEEGRRLSGAMLKKLASADKITERPMYQAERTFWPSHTLIMACNFLPKIGSTDTGTWRRIAVVPFKAVFDGKAEIKDYAGVLFNEDSDAILSWIVEGAVKYIKNGCSIKTPQVVDDTTKQYRSDEDWLGNFIQECCEIGAFEEGGGNLYDAYVAWCEKNNESYKRRPRDFSAALEVAGYDKRRTMHGSVWSGLRLLENADTQSLSKYRGEKIKQTNVLDDDGLDAYTRKRM